MTVVEIDPRIKARRVEVLRSQGRRRRRWLVGVLAIVALAATAVWLTQSPVLDVDAVKVVGAERTAPEAVVEAAAVERGVPMLGLDLAAARQAVAELPWVAEVRSIQEWPNTVTFAVTERTAAAQVEAPAGWAAVDGEGRVLAVSPEPFAELAVVTGVVAGAPGTWLPDAHMPAVAVGGALSGDLPAQVTAVWVDPVYGVVLDLAAGGVVIWGGAEGADDKNLALQTMFDQVDLSCLARLDISVPDAPVLTRDSGCT